MVAAEPTMQPVGENCGSAGVSEPARSTSKGMIPTDHRSAGDTGNIASAALAALVFVISQINELPAITVTISTGGAQTPVSVALDGGNQWVGLRSRAAAALSRAALDEQMLSTGMEFSCGIDAPSVSGEPVRLRLQPDTGSLLLTAESLGGGAELSSLLLGRVLAVIEYVLRPGSPKPGEADLVTDDERRIILEEFGRGPALNQRTTVVHMLAAAIERNPGALFVIDGETRLTYAEADERINAMSDRLCRAGIGSGDRVAMCAHPSADLVLAVFAVLRLGAAYVPISPGDPEDRREYIVANSLASAVITDVGPLTVPQGVNTLTLDELRCAEARPVQGLAPAGAVDPGDEVYIMYTSGTTGRPKGVVLTHGGVSNLIHSLADQTHLPAEGAVLFHTRFSFDASVSELLLPPATGLTIVVAPTGQDVQNLADLIERHRVCFVSMVPSVISAFLELTENRRTLASVSTFLSVGEALPLKLAKRFLAVAKAHGSAVTLHNMYGPTETSVFATGFQVPDDVARITLGGPLANVQLYVLSPGTDQLAAVGVPGEICIAGPGVGEGYVGLPVLTQARFAPDPCGAGKMYRTGDIGRWLPSGQLDYLGRRDDQVKVRGHRIELGEIEQVLSACDWVDDARCCIRLTDGRASIHAFVRQTRDAGVDVVGRTQAWAASRLPPHMCPATVTALEEMPVNANGKVDRSRLAALVETGSKELMPLRGSQELLLGATIGRLLKTAAVSADDTFLGLGGDSLTAVLVAAALREHGRTLDLVDLVGGETIRECAAKMQAFHPDSGPEPSMCREPAPGGVPALLPLTPMQEGILSTSLQDRSGSTFIVQQRYDASPDSWNTATLRQAVQDLGGRHPALRVRILADSDGTPVQAVDAKVEIPFEECRLTGRDEIDEFLRRDRVEPFALETGPLIRFAWLEAPDQACLVMTYHHLVLDGFSQDIVMCDLLSCYAGRSAGRPLAGESDETLVRHYGESMRAQQSKAADSGYWANLLGDHDASAGSALWPSRNPEGTPIGSASLSTGGALAREITNIARAEAVTPSAVIETAWAIVLSEFTGARDVLFGKVVTQRGITVSRAGETAGLFINTVPARHRFNGSMRLKDLIAAVHKQSLNTVSRSHGRLTDMLSAGNQPAEVLQTLYLYENDNERRAAVRAQGLRLNANSTEQTGRTLTLLVAERGDTYRLTVLYDGHFLGRDDMTVFLQCLEQCLSVITTDVNLRVAEMPALLAGETVPDRSGSLKSGTAPVRVDEAFARTVEKHADRAAVVHGTESLTYRELDARAERVASALLAGGLQPGAAVGLFANPTLEYLVNLLGIVMAGGAYVPLDPDLPDSRLRSLIGTAGAGLFVAAAKSDAARIERLSEGAGAPRVITAAGLPDRRGRALPRRGTGEDPIYVMYTSGTTGEPKGVIIPHRAVTNLILDAGYASLNSGSTILQTAAMSFDASTFEIWGAWLNGATLVLTEKNTILDSALLRQTIKVSRITHMWLTSSLFNLHVEQAPDAFRPLEELLVGGEALSSEHVRRFYEHNPDTILINGYGPTETTTFATTHRIERDFTSIPIGRPIARTGAHVMREGREVGIARPGELWITGAGVALGYIASGIDTAPPDSRAFVPNPFGPGLAYRTGDLVRRDADGTLDYLGRMDHQVKIRGYRVEPNGIASILLTFDGITQAVVLPRTTTTGATELVAFVVGREDLDGRRIRDELADRLPAYAVPADIRVLPALPLATTGKVDRRALIGAAEPGHEADATGPAEEANPVLRAYTEVFGTSNMSADADFFESGGDSLKAMKLVYILRMQGYDVDIRTVMTEPTAARLAGALRPPENRGEGRSKPKMAEPAEPAVRAMHAAAVGVYGAYRNDPGSLAYNVPFAVAFNGRVDRTLLATFLKEFVLRHESLRTAFDVREGAFAEVPADIPGLELQPIEVGTTIEDTVRAFAQPFRLEYPPLIRAGFAAMQTGDLLVVDAHHIAFDGESLNIFLTELAYAFDTEEPKPAAGSGLDSGTGRNAELESWRAADLKYWMETFAFPPQPLQLALSIGGERGRLEVINREVPQPLRTQLDRTARKHDMTAFMVYAAAVAILLQKYTMQEDIVLGVPVDLRARSGRGGEVGMRVNTIPLRLQPEDTATCEQFLRGVRDTAASAITHAGLPLSELTHALSAQGISAAGEIVRVMLAFRTSGGGQLKFGEATARVIGPFSLEPKFDLEVTVTREESRDVLGLEVRTSVVDAESARLLMDHLLEIISSITANSDEKIADIFLS